MIVVKNSLNDALFKAVNYDQQYVRKRPDVVALASVISLARVIEPELLRALRLRLSPQFKVQVTVDSESALWFSSFVESRGVGGITLLPAALQILRIELAKDQQLLEEAYKIIKSFHEFSPDVLQWEERIIYFAITGQQSRLEEEALRGVRSISQEIRRPLVNWINEMWHRLPPEARSNPLIIKLNQVALGLVFPRLIGKKELGALEPNIVFDFSSFPMRNLGIVLEDNNFLIGDVPGAKLGIQVPDLDPVELEVISSQKLRPLVIPRGKFAKVNALEAVRIKALSGQIYQLDPQLFIYPQVFISYSYETPEHKKQVLEVSKRLRDDGVATQLDQYVNGTPEQTWPRWMLDQLDWADYVLCICTETYYRRFRGYEEPGTGKGADWEGAIITQEIYDRKNLTKKLVPVLFKLSDKKFIPEPLHGHTFYVWNTKAGYENLYAFLHGRADVKPRQLGTPKIGELPRIEPIKFEDDPSLSPQTTKDKKEDSNTSYETFNDDPEIKKIASNKIQQILDKDLMTGVKDNLCNALCRIIDDMVEKRIAEILVELPVLNAIIKLDYAVREFFDPEDMPQKQKEHVFSQWELCLDLLGWLLLLTIHPEWRKKQRSFFRNNTSLNFTLPVTDKSGADIALASIMETPADVTRSGIKRLYGCCDIGVELGINKSDTSRMIAKCIYRALFKKGPDISKDYYLKEINADLLASAYRNRLRYLTIDSNDRDNPLNNEATLNELKGLLPNLSIIHIGVQWSNVDVFLVPEPDIMANIQLFLQIGTQLRTS